MRNTFHDLFSFRRLEFGHYNQSENRPFFKCPLSKCAQFSGRNHFFLPFFKSAQRIFTQERKKQASHEYINAFIMLDGTDNNLHIIKQRNISNSNVIHTYANKEIGVPLRVWRFLHLLGFNLGKNSQYRKRIHNIAIIIQSLMLINICIYFYFSRTTCFYGISKCVSSPLGPFFWGDWCKSFCITISRGLPITSSE